MSQQVGPDSENSASEGPGSGGPGSFPEVKAARNPAPPHPRVAPHVLMVLAALAVRLAAVAFLYPE